jgi:hypothetical protein
LPEANGDSRGCESVALGTAGSWFAFGDAAEYWTTCVLMGVICGLLGVTGSVFVGEEDESNGLLER